MMYTYTGMKVFYTASHWFSFCWGKISYSYTAPKLEMYSFNSTNVVRSAQLSIVNKVYIAQLRPDYSGLHKVCLQNVPNQCN